MRRIRNFIGKQYDYLVALLLKIKYLLIIIKQLLDKKSFCHEIKEKVEKNEYTLFVTHNLGGGTDLFVNNYVKKYENIIVITNIMQKVDIVYKVSDINTGKSFFVFNLKRIFRLRIKTLIVNSFVSYHNIPRIQKNILKFKEKSNFELIYNVHDFHCICPRHNLINKDFFCYLNCKNNKCKFTNDYECTSIRIDKWRLSWKEFLLYCNRIVCFCKSSKNYVLEIYNLDENRIEVFPHDISYIKYTKIRDIEKKELHLGIIGACGSIPKGKKEVEKLVKMLPTKIPVTFIGSEKEEYSIQRENTFFLGRYKNGTLQDYIEKSDISVIFFPSVWPETFSYLLSELMKMDIPIIGYNMGAQFEKLSTYAKGFLCENVYEVYDKIVYSSKMLE